MLNSYNYYISISCNLQRMKTSKFKIRSHAHHPENPSKISENSEVKVANTVIEKTAAGKSQTMIYKNGLQQSYYPASYLEPRDRHILVDSHRSDGSEFDDEALQKWMGSVCRDVMSTAFNSYISEQMTYQQAQIYVCQQILGNIAALAQKAQITPQLFEKVDKILKLKILPYLAMKYPLSQSTDIYRNLNQVVKQINNIEVLSNDFLYNSNIVFQFRQNGNYTDLIMQVVNQLISSTDEQTNDDGNGGQRNNYSDFTQFMTNQFEKVYDFDWISKRVKLMKNSTLRVSKQQQNNSKQEGDALEKLRYKQKVQQYTHYEIGRKIPQSMAKYNEQQISNGFMQIKSPQILRILTKWCEQLWQKFQNECYYVDRAEGISMTRSKQINITYEWLKRDLKPFLAQQKIAIIQYMKDVEANLYQQQFKIIHSQLLSKQSPFLQRYERICGKFAVKVVRNLQNCIIIYLNRLIHGLMKVSRSIFVKLKGKPSWPYPPNLISLKIGDLLRCRIFSKQNEIKAIYELLQMISEKQPQKLLIIRVKNRLKLGTNDLLVNVRFNNTLTAEIQLKVKAQKLQTQFSKCSFNFSHFIYEMSRSQFGPISEMCSIWNNLQRRSKIYQQLVNNQNLTQNNSFQKESYCIRNSVPHMMLIITNNPFICNSCGKSYSNDNFILPHTTCKNCRYYQCALCCINQAKGIDLIQELIQDSELAKYLKQQRSINNIPDLGVMIPIRSRLRYIIRFKIIEILGKKYVFKKNGTDQFQLVVQLKNEKQIRKFLNSNLVFEFLLEEPEEYKRFNMQTALKDVILCNYVKNCYRTKKETISLTRMGGLVLKDTDFEEILAGHKESKSYIKHFQASNQNLQNVNFLNQDFSNLELINLNINQMKSFDALTKFTKLHSLFLGQNSLVDFPIQICCIPIRYLNIASNNIKIIPPQIEKIITLEVIKMNANKITQFPIALTRLANLREIYANKNSIQLLPDEIGSCSKLQVLQMQNNTLKSLPLSLQNLVTLQKLDLKGNKLQKIQPNLSHLKKLKQFSFASNKITNLPQNSPSIFCQSLDMSFNKLGEETNLSNIQMPNLKTLSLQQCNLVTLTGTKAILSVSQLNIKGNNMKTLPTSFAVLQNLRILHANKCQIVTIDEICNIRSLRELYLQENRQLHLSQKISFLKLTTLNVSDCNLKQVHTSICKIKTLKNLYISANRIVQVNADIKLLRQMLILDISNNRIKILPNEINSLINLKTFLYHQKEKVDINNVLDAIFRLQVKQLSLTQRNLEQMPQDININKNIYQLNLGRNLLKQVPSIIVKLPYLNNINLGNNQIKVVGEHLFKLVSLTELRLNNNLIEELPDKFNCLKLLMYLDVDYNKLNQLPRSIEGLLLNGCTLVYKNNAIRQEPLWLVAGNYENYYMNLGSHQLSVLPRFSNKHYYRYITLESNQFEQIPKQLELLKVTTLNLNNNKIKIIPEWFFKFQLLQHLFLENNLIEEIPSNITSFKKLCKMRIAGNPIKKIDSSINTISFKEISLSGSTIDLLALAQDKDMKLLKSQELHIYQEESSQITPNIGRLSSKLVIIKSSKAQVLPTQIGSIAQLNELNCQMPVKQLPPSLGQSTFLLRVTIKSNKMSTFPVQILQAKSIQILKITDTLIQQIPQQISSLINLQRLYFSHNKLRSLSQNMKLLTKLYEIDFSYNQLTEIPKCLQLLNINKINLSFNKISIAGANLQNFKAGNKCINLQGNPITKVDDASALLKFGDEGTIQQFQHLIALQTAK